MAGGWLGEWWWWRRWCKCDGVSNDVMGGGWVGDGWVVWGVWLRCQCVDAGRAGRRAALPMLNECRCRCMSMRADGVMQCLASAYGGGAMRVDDDDAGVVGAMRRRRARARARAMSAAFGGDGMVKCMVQCMVNEIAMVVSGIAMRCYGRSVWWWW